MSVMRLCGENTGHNPQYYAIIHCKLEVDLSKLALTPAANGCLYRKSVNSELHMQVVL